MFRYLSKAIPNKLQNDTLADPGGLGSEGSVRIDPGNMLTNLGSDFSLKCIWPNMT